MLGFWVRYTVQYNSHTYSELSCWVVGACPGHSPPNPTFCFSLNAPEIQTPHAFSIDTGELSICLCGVVAELSLTKCHLLYTGWEEKLILWYSVKGKAFPVYIAINCPDITPPLLFPKLDGLILSIIKLHIQMLNIQSLEN